MTSRDPADLVRDDLIAAFGLLSRLPLPASSVAPDPRAAWAWPVVGAALGALAALAASVALALSLPTGVAAGIALITGALLTGGLHEDGLADTADGLFGGHTRERRLEIMKDSRIGAFAAIALALSLILKVALLAVLPDRFGWAGSALLLVGVEALSRCLALWQWSTLPAARPDGLAARFGVPGMDAVLNGLGLTALVLLPLVFVLPFLSLVCGLVASALAAHATGRLAFAKISGFTGDVIGAVQQLSALAFLLGVLVLA